MTEKKGMTTGRKILLGAVAAGATVYAADKLDIIATAEGMYNSAKDYIVDIFTTSLDEASALYQNKLREEQNIRKRNQVAGNTIKNEIHYLSGLEKLAFVEYTFEQLPPEMKFDAARMSTRNLPDSSAEKIIIGMQNNSSKELNLSTGYNGLENVIGKTGSEVGNFIKNGYRTIESKIDSLF